MFLWRSRTAIGFVGVVATEFRTQQLSNIHKLSYSNRWLSQAIRNVAIVAHVDHGKTTLVDTLLKASGTVVEGERVMDSNQLEKERGITILAKTISIPWRETQINIVDTPGHVDFGGEVERTLSMVDGVVLVVDVNEGPMAQTKFVVSKAIKAGLRPIVCLNKIDRCENLESRSDTVVSQIFELFHSMGANDDQLDFTVLYASARNGWAIASLGDERKNMYPLLDAIVKHVPPPRVEEGPFKMLVSMMEHDPHFGTVVTGRIHSGSITPNIRLKSLSREGNFVEEGRLLRIMARRSGMAQVILNEAVAGDIVTLAGLPNSRVTCTVCDPSVSTPLPAAAIDPPTISMTFSPNTSPLSGTEGTFVTSSHIQNRLYREMATNVSIIVRPSTTDESFEVCGRGPLQMGILLENMRREGYEIGVSPPRVILTTDEKGRSLEPIEELTLEMDDQYSGIVIEMIATRKGELKEYIQNNGRTTLIYHIPARGLIGIQHIYLMATHGTGLIHHLYHSHEPYKGELPCESKGRLVSTAGGTATAYALFQLEPRGILFIDEGTQVYEGMIVGENSKAGDLPVNPTKSKKLTNVRSVQAEEKLRISPPKIMTLEESIGYINDDELIEITPKNIRLRKKYLDGKRR